MRVHDALHDAKRRARERRYLLGALHGLFHQLGRRRVNAHEPQIESFQSRDATPAVPQLLRLVDAAGLGEKHHGAHLGGKGYVEEVGGEDRLIGGIDHIARQSEAEATAHGVPLDRRDEGLLAILDIRDGASEHGDAVAALLHAFAATGGHAGQIAPRAEAAALAAQHDRAHLVVVLHFEHGRTQLPHHGRSHGVLAGRVVQHDLRNARVVLLDVNKLVHQLPPSVDSSASLRLSPAPCPPT